MYECICMCVFVCIRNIYMKYVYVIYVWGYYGREYSYVVLNVINFDIFGVEVEGKNKVFRMVGGG